MTLYSKHVHVHQGRRGYTRGIQEERIEKTRRGSIGSNVGYEGPDMHKQRPYKIHTSTILKALCLALCTLACTGKSWLTVTAFLYKEQHRYQCIGDKVLISRVTTACENRPATWRGRAQPLTLLTSHKQQLANVLVKAGGRGQPDNNLVFCSAVQSCAVLLGAVFCTGCRVISYMYRVDLRCRSETIAKQKSQVVYVCFLTAILKK